MLGMMQRSDEEAIWPSWKWTTLMVFAGMLLIFALMGSRPDEWPPSHAATPFGFDVR
jgi:hypothetical protein